VIRKESPFLGASEELASVFADAASFVAREFAEPTARPIIPKVSAKLFDEIVEGGLPEEGMGLRTLSETAQRFLSQYTARLVPSGFSAMVTTSPNPYALLADILICAFNQHQARGDVGEFGARLEARVVRWIGDFINYPASSGTLTGGGASANVIALAAARRKALGPDVRRRGIAGAPLVAYASSETHMTTVRALDVLGLGGDNLRRLKSDEGFRLDVSVLQSAIDGDRKAGSIPFAVIGQGGSVATGAVDALREIGALCERERLWFHVDAAYGGPAAAVDKALFAGLESAHSVTIDPHKWLYVNYECGCLLTREEHVLEAAFGESVSYLAADTPTDAPDFMSLGIDVSRGLRALKVWATFAGLGAAALRRSISQDIALAGHFANLLSRRPQFVLHTPSSLSIVVFRFVPVPNLASDYLDALNRKIPQALREDGRIYLGSTLLRGEYVLRACLINHRVTDDDLVRWVNILEQIGNKLHEHRRHWWPDQSQA
jgi:aromatic-L-amino-acid decarboxylase